MMYTLIGHKPESASYCRGNLMDSYSGDFVLWAGPDPDELARRWADLIERNGKLDRAESGYDISVLADGYPLLSAFEGEMSATSDLQDVLLDEHQVSFNAVIAKRDELLAGLHQEKEAARLEQERKAALAAQEAARAAAAAKEAAERAEYLRLQSKFGGQA